MIHKTTVLNSDAVARTGTRIVSFEKLADLRQSVGRFAQALASNNSYGDPIAVREQLTSHGLEAGVFFSQWGREPQSHRA